MPNNIDNNEEPRQLMTIFFYKKTTIIFIVKMTKKQGSKIKFFVSQLIYTKQLVKLIMMNNMY